MKIKDAISYTFDIEIEKGETVNIRLGNSRNTMKVVIGETEGNIAFLFKEDPIIKDGGPDEVRDAGKINSYAQIEFNLKPEEED